MIHATWYKAPSIEIDPECSYLLLERPLRVGPFASIGFPGFGFHEDDKNLKLKDHPFGVIVLEGASLQSHVTIDRGSWRNTKIGRNARINNYAHIGHNVQIADNVTIGAGARIAGSTEIGSLVTIWNGALIKHHLKIGEGAVIGMGAVVIRDVEPDTIMVGNPARALKK